MNMSKFKQLIDTFDSSQLIDYTERDELKDSLYETLNFKDKINVAQRQLNEYLKHHKVLNFIFILPIKIKMVLFSVLLWLSPAIITLLIGLLINHFVPSFYHDAITGMQSNHSKQHIIAEAIYSIGALIIMISSFITLIVTIWNMVTFLGRGDRSFKDDNLYTLNGLKYVLVEDQLEDDEIYWVNYIKMHIIEFNEKVLILFMYIFKRDMVCELINRDENKLVDYYNEPVLNQNKQIFRRHEVIKDVNKDDDYLVSYKYIDSQMKSISQLKKSKAKKQRLYYDSDNELNAFKQIINENKNSFYNFKMIITKLTQLYKLNQLRLSEEKFKKEQKYHNLQREKEKFDKKEVKRLIKELQHNQVSHKDQINKQIRHNQ